MHMAHDKKYNNTNNDNNASFTLNYVWLFVISIFLYYASIFLYYLDKTEFLFIKEIDCIYNNWL